MIRADVAGRTESLASHGASGIVAPDGHLLRTARQFVPDLIVADIERQGANRGQAARFETLP